MKFSTADWTLCTPRRWQPEAMEAVRAHLDFHGEPAVVRAIMGSGKSIVIAELCACAELAREEVVVITTPTKLLVRQLYDTIRARCEPIRGVGIWYSDSKRIGQVIVCCAPSAVNLAETLSGRGRKVALWIADEAHKTECDTLITASKELAPKHIIGFTATPFRAHESHTLSVFRHQIYSYGAERALADGVVVPWRIEGWKGKDCDLNSACIEMIHHHGKGPGLVNAVSIEDAESFAKYLTSRDIQAATVHSRKPHDQIKGLVRDLCENRLKALVHVNMLAEGADFPWLRWLCLRREVGSRVRFSQEIGRALRSHPGKSEAVFLDPNDLFGQFRLSYEEALGERSTEDEYEESEPRERGKMLAEAKDALAQTMAEGEIRRLVCACEAAGMLPNRIILSRHKRTQDSTKVQHVVIGRLVDEIERLVPDNWYPLVRAIGSRKGLLRRGWAADLVCSLRAVGEYSKWPPLDSDGRINAGVEAEAPVTPEGRRRAILDWGEQMELPFEDVLIAAIQEKLQALSEDSR